MRIELEIKEETLKVWPCLPAALQAMIFEANKAAVDPAKGRFHSDHEGYGVLAEEVAELLEAIRQGKVASIGEEAQHVGITGALMASQIYERKYKSK